jgi:hypothetical protein
MDTPEENKDQGTPPLPDIEAFDFGRIIEKAQTANIHVMFENDEIKIEEDGVVVFDGKVEDPEAPVTM